MDVLARANITVLGYDVVCGACGWAGYLSTEQVELLAAHHRPMLLGVHTSIGLWTCSAPRPLRTGRT